MIKAENLDESCGGGNVELVTEFASAMETSGSLGCAVGSLDVVEQARLDGAEWNAALQQSTKRRAVSFQQEVPRVRFRDGVISKKFGSSPYDSDR